MKQLFRVIPLLIIFLCIAGLAACNDEDEVFDETADRARLEKMEVDIDALIGDAECKGDPDCRAIAFGDKPCGGPWSYKVFSASTVDTIALAGLVTDYNKFNKVINERYGGMSDCMYVTEPGVGCVEGRCVARNEKESIE